MFCIGKFEENMALSRIYLAVFFYFYYFFIGIPITLCLLYCVVTKMLGVVTTPINFPRHFLLRWKNVGNYRSSLIQFGLIWSYLAQFNASPFWLHCYPRSLLIQYDQFWSSLILFDSIWSCLIRFDHAMFDRVWSFLIYFDPVWSNFWFLLIHFDPLWPLLIQIDPTFDTFWSILNQFDPI